MKGYETREDITPMTPNQKQGEGGNNSNIDNAQGSPAEGELRGDVLSVPPGMEAEPEVREAESIAITEAPLPAQPIPYEDAVDEEEPHRFSFQPPTRNQLLNWVPFWAVILLGGILRFWGLGDKPLHHDESLHAYFSLQLLHNNIQNWVSCFDPVGATACYRYDPLLHGPFQFHAIAFVYLVSQWVGAADHGVNTLTVRIAAATLGTLIVALPFFLRDYLGKIGAWLACFLLAVSPSIVYFSRFAREDIYMAFFTLLMVVAVARYVRDRKMRWIVIAVLAFAFSYATKEATFLSIAVFGSFMGALLAWELGLKLPIRSRVPADTAAAKWLPQTGAPVLLVAYFFILAPIAKVLFGWMKSLSIYITDPRNKSIADAFVQNLKDRTVAIVPWIGILLGIFVLSILVREMTGRMPQPGRHGVAKRVDPAQQPLLDAILTMPWTHWFFALLAGWTVFLVLFTALFTNIRGGIGDGIWQGLYYWLQQQQVARGGQPWYYYFLLIPLYEQVGLIFGIVGVVRSLLKPTRFRLFLVYWCIGNLAIYSWAAEKMPWLVIHITIPMLLLAAVGLEPVVVTLINLARERFARSSTALVIAENAGSSVPSLSPPVRPKVGVLAGSSAALSLILASLLLLPTLHNMYEVSYVHAADGPHEMMVYVQTTTDVDTVMARIDKLDQQVYGGKHLMPIGIMNDAVWPFAWYLRDYTNVCFNYPDGCTATARNIPVIITGQDNLYTAESQYATPTNKAPASYLFHQYHMRTWWDEGYKPPPCVASKTNTCADQQTWGGVGPFLWLSYGDNPPPGATFNAGLAAQRIWQWWWYRKPFGSVDGTYDMGLFIRKDLGVMP